MFEPRGVAPVWLTFNRGMWFSVCLITFSWCLRLENAFQSVYINYRVKVYIKVVETELDCIIIIWRKYLAVQSSVFHSLTIISLRDQICIIIFFWLLYFFSFFKSIIQKMLNQNPFCVTAFSKNDRGHQEIYIKHYNLWILCEKVHMIHNDFICFLFVTYLQL